MYTDGALLEMCDTLRNKSLPEVGVVLEDKDGHTVIKLVGKEAALKEREAVVKVRGVGSCYGERGRQWLR